MPVELHRHRNRRVAAMRVRQSLPLSVPPVRRRAIAASENTACSDAELSSYVDRGIREHSLLCQHHQAVVLTVMRPGGHRLHSSLSCDRGLGSADHSHAMVALALSATAARHRHTAPTDRVRVAERVTVIDWSASGPYGVAGAYLRAK